jgi:hypothetical protein
VTVAWSEGPAERLSHAVTNVSNSAGIISLIPSDSCAPCCNLGWKCKKIRILINAHELAG